MTPKQREFQKYGKHIATYMEAHKTLHKLDTSNSEDREALRLMAAEIMPSLMPKEMPEQEEVRRLFDYLRDTYGMGGER